MLRQRLTKRETRTIYPACRVLEVKVGRGAETPPAFFWSTPTPPRRQCPTPCTRRVGPETSFGSFGSYGSPESRNPLGYGTGAHIRIAASRISAGQT